MWNAPSPPLIFILPNQQKITYESIFRTCIQLRNRFQGAKIYFYNHYQVDVKDHNF